MRCGMGVWRLGRDAKGGLMLYCDDLVFSDPKCLLIRVMLVNLLTNLGTTLKRRKPYHVKMNVLYVYACICTEFVAYNMHTFLVSFLHTQFYH